MNYSVTGYNPYINDSSYHFNSKIATRNVAFTSQPNTVSLSSNNQTSTKTGLSKNAKLGLGALALAGIGVVAYILSRGKVGSKSVQQLAEHVEFKEAKTMDDAIKFAKENFGIKLDLGDNLFAANLVNESCANVSNAMRGKAYFPKKIKFGAVNSSRAAGGYDNISNIIVIGNKNTDWGIVYEFFNKTLKTKNSYLEYSEQLKSNQNTIFNDMYEIIYHELGHCNHKAICKNFEKMGKLKEVEYMLISDKSIINEFLNNKAIQKTAGKVSEYSKESPAEFVAEVFARRIQGKIFSDDIMALYKKYGGPVLS